MATPTVEEVATAFLKLKGYGITKAAVAKLFGMSVQSLDPDIESTSERTEGRRHSGQVGEVGPYRQWSVPRKNVRKQGHLCDYITKADLQKMMQEMLKNQDNS